MITPAASARALILAALVLTGQSACAVGPRYAGPPSGEPPAAFVRAPQSAVSDRPLSNSWWKALNDPVLDALETEVLVANPHLEAGRARLGAARAALLGEKAKGLPSGSIMGDALTAQFPTRDLAALTKTPGASGGTTAFDLYAVGADALWEVDLFGARKHAVEKAAAEAGVAAAGLSDLQLSLTAEAASAYAGLGEAQALESLLAEAQDLARAERDFIRGRIRQGLASDRDLDAAEVRLSDLEGRRAALLDQEARAKDALAVLVGKSPGALDALLSRTGAAPIAPETTAIGAPADFLKRRPDIRQAERRLAAANAEVGEAVAAYFPTLQLVGDLTLSGTRPGDAFNTANLTAVGSPTLAWNILSWPRLKANERGARAELDAADADYRATVLEALQDANASLSRFGAARAAARTAAFKQAASGREVGRALDRLKAGTGSQRELDAARLQAVLDQSQTVQTQADLTRAWINLQKSLGLGLSPQ